MVELSGVVDDLQHGEQITDTVVLNKLLTESEKKFHTEIIRPPATSLIDSVIPVYADELEESNPDGSITGGGMTDLLANWQDWQRTNMVAFHRKRALEIKDAVSARKSAQEGKMDKIIGELGK